MTDMPRRNCLDKLTPLELCLYLVQQQVEREGAHPMLTDALVHIGKARDSIADYVERPASGWLG